MLKTCLIFSGGNVVGDEYIPQRYEYVVSADGGYSNALKLDLLPNLCIGDFDTLTDGIDPSCEVIKYPPEKDDTDTMLCVKKAISMGYDNLYIYGATGGRLDHFIANVQCLEHALDSNVLAYIVDSQNVITMQGVSTRVYPKSSTFKYYSLLSLSDSAKVSATGLKYPLQDTTLRRDFPLGVSNEVVSDVAIVTVHKGTVLVFYSKD